VLTVLVFLWGCLLLLLLELSLVLMPSDDLQSSFLKYCLRSILYYAGFVFFVIHTLQQLHWHQKCSCFFICVLLCFLLVSIVKYEGRVCVI